MPRHLAGTCSVRPLGASHLHVCKRVQACLQTLRLRAQAAIDAEDYDVAKQIKLDIEKLRLVAAAPSMDSSPAMGALCARLTTLQRRLPSGSLPDCKRPIASMPAVPPPGVTDCAHAPLAAAPALYQPALPRAPPHAFAMSEQRGEDLAPVEAGGDDFEYARQSQELERQDVADDGLYGEPAGSGPPKSGALQTAAPAAPARGLRCIWCNGHP